MLVAGAVRESPVIVGGQPGGSRRAQVSGRLRHRSRALWRQIGLAAVIGFGWLAAMTALANPAAAHAFLVSTDPPSGARLAATPSRIRLVFTEAVDTSGNRIELRDATGHRQPVGPLVRGNGGRSLEVSTVGRLAGGH